MLRSVLAAVVLCATAITSTAHATDRQTLGYGRLFTNDFLGDGEDRWRTGSYSVSKIRGLSWDGERPEAFGELLEFRVRSDIFAPESLTAPAAGDRQYAGALSFGVHTYFARGGVDFSVGGDIIVTGEQNGLSRFQTEIHEILGAAEPVAANNQIGNGIYGALTFEMSRELEISDRLSFRPFIEALVGPEDLVRVGGDFLFGRVGQNDLMLRDVATGQLYRGTRGDDIGLSFAFGADIAFVEDSVYLPSAGGYELTDSRSRARLGMHWQGHRAAVFYGMTYLTEEFVGQNEGQLLGSVQLNLRF
ncbi:lipid A-modifier LpxR family protein [Cochlodiniinecator piscidefendens]|uniref:lipid A-modifier LpxR family protein n=1 Tax=Cochlodiniinecator piscidefendens TaxID=2715756 RepID=UPI00140D4B29|nr:lipid A-modifier LpxR family protein [Cochlodiniinecator piscidefendens]